MKIKIWFTGCLFTVFSLTALSQLNGFQYYRETEEVKYDGWHKIVIKSKVFKNLAGEYASLRLFEVEDTDTIEVPYIFERKPKGFFRGPCLTDDPISSERITIHENRVQKKTMVHLDIGFDLELCAIQFYVRSNRDYYYRYFDVYVEEEEEGIYRDRERYDYSILKDYLSSKDKNIFYFESIYAGDLRIEIENEDNQPLIVDSVKVYSPVYELYAQFYIGKTYFLAYGNDDLEEPVYDIVRFSCDIPGKLNELKTGEEISIIKDKDTPIKADLKTDPGDEKLWIWIIMIGVILVLGFFTFRIVLNTSDEERNGKEK